MGRGLGLSFDWRCGALDATAAVVPPEGDTLGSLDEDGVVPNT